MPSPSIDRRPAVWDVLLDGVNTDERHRGSDEQAFRLTYPFSPALVSTLRSLASVMQRERTALKVMQQMLVDRRDTLTIDEIIPVGDSFDLVVQGQTGQALDAEAAALFRSANKLYTEKLRPLLLGIHGLDARAVSLAGREAPESVPAAYRTDDRLAKTLLLSAVAPKVPALMALTAARLASLNHGSIVSPLPGGEAGVVLSKVRTWARDVPEIHLDGDDRNPTIRVQLSDVDYETIVERAKGEDNEGRRRELLKDLVAESLGIALNRQDLQGAYPHDVVWRGSRRRVDVLFGNVRDRSWLSDEHFQAAPDTWRVIIDHPFDEQGHSSAEDRQRLDEMVARNAASRTIVWLPRFLSEEKLREVRRLVILNWLLDGNTERWQGHADHLNETDRALARSILESQRNTLRRSLEDAVQQAYGAAAPRPGVLLDDPGRDRTLYSLERLFAPVNPIGATLGQAFENLLGQAFESVYPAHPHFEPGDVEVKVRDLKVVAGYVARCVTDSEKRIELGPDAAVVRRIAGPLGVGKATEMHYLLGDDRFTPWGQEIERALGRRAQEKGTPADDPVTVRELRDWIQQVRPAHGLRDEVADLVVITWAALRQRAWFHHGTALPTAPDPGSLSPAMELRTQDLPSPGDWEAARSTAGALLGIPAAAYLTAPAVAEFVGKVTDTARDLAQHAPDLITAVESAYRRLGIADGDRLAHRPRRRGPGAAAPPPPGGQARRDDGRTPARGGHPGRRRQVPRLGGRGDVGAERVRLAPSRPAAQGHGRRGRARHVGRRRRQRPARDPGTRRAGQPHRPGPDGVRGRHLRLAGRQQRTPRTAARTAGQETRDRSRHPTRRNRQRRRADRPGDLPRRAPGRRRRGVLAGVAVTVTTAATPVSAAMVLAIVDQARSQRYEGGVIGVRGLPDRAVTADLQHEGHTVRVRPAESALAAREVLTDREGADWLVVVTDRDDDDLGAGVLAHLVWQRLRSPDPWEAVRHRFSATGIDPALTSAPHSRDLAAALLAATPSTGWPAAPAGVLTRTHALGAVAAAHLGVDGDNADVLGVLRWAMTAQSVAALGTLRRAVGDLLTDVTLDWIAQRAGVAAAPIRALLARGELADVVPLGVVLHLLTGGEVHGQAAAHQAQLALVRLEPRWGETAPGAAALSALGQAANVLLSELVHDRRADADVRRALDRADVMLAQLQGGALARYSELLASGLRARFVVLAEALRRAVGPDGGAEAMRAVEAAWDDVCAHRFAGPSPLRGPAEAAVRLARWLALPAPQDPPAGGAAALGALARRHLTTGAWVDSAINDAFAGVDDTEISPALQVVVSAAQDRRRREERRFAAALAAAPAPSGDGVPSDAGTVWYLERLLPGAVLPLAKRTPVLLLVMDGMSAATATEILADATDRLGWQEAALPGMNPEHRGAALAVLPSLTEVSRASLLCGRLVRGQQSVEQSGYTELTAQGGKISAQLFHKKVIDTTAAGWSVSHDVGAALDDQDVRLVTVVLNTIDDALDRSDPAGTVWTADAVKHLEPLLARAAAAGRTVVMTADHGHVVERRQGKQQPHPGTSSGRSRSVTGAVEDGEVEVSGPRVLTEDHRAVLAVDDTLRYGPLKAGYHGGASAAEVVVPVAVLVREESDHPKDLTPLPPQVPAWWITAPGVTVVRPGREALRRAGRGRRDGRDPVRPRPGREGAGSLDQSRTCRRDERRVSGAAQDRGAAHRLGRPGLPLGRCARRRERHPLAGHPGGAGARGRADPAARCPDPGAAAAERRGLRGAGRRAGDRGGHPRRRSSPGAVRGAVVTAESVVSPRRRREVIDALRRGTVPANGLDLFAVGVERFTAAVDAELDAVAGGGSAFKAVRGEYGSGQDLHHALHLRTSSAARFRRGRGADLRDADTAAPARDRLPTDHRVAADGVHAAQRLPATVGRLVVHAERRRLAEGLRATGADVERLLDARLRGVSASTPAFAQALRAYRRGCRCRRRGDRRGAVRLAGRPAQRRGRGQADRRCARRTRPLRRPGVPAGPARRAAGRRATRVWSWCSTRSRPCSGCAATCATRRLNAAAPAHRRDRLRSLPGPVPRDHRARPAFFDGPQGVQRLPPLAQRLATDFGTDVRFDNPRAVQIRLPGFDRAALVELGTAGARPVRRAGQPTTTHPRRSSTTRTSVSSADAVTGSLGGRVGIAPRVFLKKLVADVLDRVDQFDDFDPRRDYALTVTAGRADGRRTGRAPRSGGPGRHRPRPRRRGLRECRRRPSPSTGSIRSSSTTS